MSPRGGRGVGRSETQQLDKAERKSSLHEIESLSDLKMPFPKISDPV
jgi:hypothetical protein